MASPEFAIFVFLVSAIAGSVGWAIARRSRPSAPVTPEALASAKKRFIAQMNRRIFNEPQIAPQLQTLRDMVVGWYELKGPVVAVRFVARRCCESCYKLDGRRISLLDVRVLARLVPPVHREKGARQDCSCTLQPVTAEVARPRVTDVKPASRPVLR